MRAAHPSVNEYRAASRFLEKALNSRALDSVSPRTGMLPRRCRTKGRPTTVIGRLVEYKDEATEFQMRIGSVLLVIWLVIGGIAVGQRGDNKGSIGCSRASTIAVTIIAGPLNYAGVNPNINCTVQHPSN
jgi:hypothetical protein